MERNEVTREYIEERTILRGLVGSTVWGLSVNDGIDDRDEMGVCVEPIELAMGLSNPLKPESGERFEQYVFRSAAEREGDANAKSRAGDLDLVIYGLRKYVRLVLKGNPTSLALLFVPKEHLVTTTPAGEELRSLTPFIVSKRAARSCLEYMLDQRERIIGERGQMRSNRPELVERHGFNTKYAMHMLRLGYQGIELLKTGRLEMPIPKPARSKLLHLRQGGFSLEWALAHASELEHDLRRLLETSFDLPEEPGASAVERWMIDTYRYSFIRDV